MGSLLMQIADSVRVPAGSALAVDRDLFAATRDGRNFAPSEYRTCSRRGSEIPRKGSVIVASGPLTSPSLSESIREFCGSEHLYFYDAISPIVDAETIDQSKVYRASRYGKAATTTSTVRWTGSEYDRFYDALVAAESVAIHEFEEAQLFRIVPSDRRTRATRPGYSAIRTDAARRSEDPATGRMPHAVVQLRQEDLMQSSYNIVGFQNHLKFASSDASSA